MLLKIMRSKSISISVRDWSRKFILRLFMCCFFAGTFAGCEGTDANSNVQNKAQLESQDSAELWISKESGREVVSTEDISRFDKMEIDFDRKLEIDSDGNIKYVSKVYTAPPKLILIDEAPK